MNPGTIDFLAPLRIDGTDAAGFLHGQFTTDVTGLASGHSCLSAWCDPKGRVIATFFLTREDEIFNVLLPGDMKEVFVKRLKMFVLRADVVITDAGPQDVPQWPHLPGTDGDLSEMTYIRQGIPLLHPETSGRFLPQELNLGNLDALSYTKGCYPGQEIIARLRYRGQVKRRLFHAATDNSTLLAPGAGLALSGEEKNIGAVINSAITDKGQELLIVLERDHIGSGKVIAKDIPGCKLRVADALER